MEEPPTWENIPTELKQLVVQKIDAATRCSFQLTSKLHKELVETTPIFIEHIIIWVKNSETANFSFGIKQESDPRAVTQHFSQFVKFLKLLQNRKSKIENFDLGTYGENVDVAKFLRLFSKKLEDLEIRLQIGKLTWRGDFGGAEEFERFMKNVDCKEMVVLNDSKTGDYFVQHAAQFLYVDKIYVKGEVKPTDLYSFVKQFRKLMIEREVPKIGTRVYYFEKEGRTFHKARLDVETDNYYLYIIFPTEFIYDAENRCINLPSAESIPWQIEREEEMSNETVLGVWDDPMKKKPLKFQDAAF